MRGAGVVHDDFDPLRVRSRNHPMSATAAFEVNDRSDRNVLDKHYFDRDVYWIAEVTFSVGVIAQYRPA
jgi:hypothetical protein